MMVIKVGGSEGIDMDSFLDDLSSYKDYILVHGGSSETNKLSELLGKPPRFLKSASGYVSRYTDKETMEIFTMTCAGKINKSIVSGLQKRGVNAIGLSGVDGCLLKGTRKSALTIMEGSKKKIIRDDYTGKVEEVNTELLTTIMKGYVPVIAPIAISEESDAINVDGDRAAALIAARMEADALIILTNVPGLLKNPNDESTLIKKIDKNNIDEYMEYAQGRMKKKVLGAIEALEEGVKKVIFSDARVAKPLTNALNGNGTVIS